MLKLKNPKPTSPSNADLAPLPERRRSTFREPAAEVDLGLFGLSKGDPEVDDVPDLAVVPAGAPAVAELSDVAVAPMTPHADEASVVSAPVDEPADVEIPEMTDAPDVTESPDATETPDVTETPDLPESPDPTETPDVPVVTPSQRRARHRADRAGNRRATGSSFRVALPAH